MFYDLELPFIPFEGEFWLSQSDIRAALAEPKTPLTPWCLDFPDELEHIDARQHTWFFKLGDLARHTIGPETYFTIPAIGYFIRNASFRKDDNGLHRRIDGFESLQACDVSTTWSARLANVQSTRISSGHFFTDQYPQETMAALLAFRSAQKMKNRSLSKEKGIP